jgi:8-oxo-dGTP pyrophosphatase MutT (NUDIX family)
MQAEALASRLGAALHPLDAPPESPWNLDDLEGLPLPAQPLPAAVLVGVIPRPAGAGVLLTRRSDGLRHHGGQVSFPGGRIEALDASPAAAALREANEEVGLDAMQARALGYLDPLLTVTGFRVLPTVVLIDPAFQARPEPGEVAAVFEVPLDLLLDPLQLEKVELQFGGRARHVFQYRYQPQRIWGATASILYNLRERLARAEPGRT